MVERQDIDALLISALYGELTPAEETRLAAHLESHPADKAALADLTHARGLVRESRLLQVQLEPPQSVSALLMKEATRCAPKPEVQEGWFARFVRSFAAHPAMAAAAMLVIVLGIGLVVTRQGEDRFAESTAPAAEPAGAYAPTNDNLAVGAGSAAVTGGMASDESVDQVETGRDSYRVALEEGKADDFAATDKKAVEKQKRSYENEDKLVKEQVATKKPAKQQGIELRAPQAAPKDFEDNTRRKGANNELAFGDNDSIADGRADTGAAAPGATLGAASRGQEAPAPSPTTTATRPVAPRGAGVTGNASPPPPPAVARQEPTRDAPKTVAKSGAKQDPKAATTADRNVTARSAGPVEEKPADPQLAWAREQHSALIAQVRAGECKKAAGIATAISNRAPAYYQQNVETDRSVKACIAYINSERERDAEQRSERARATQKRSLNEPAPSKPTASDATK